MMRGHGSPGRAFSLPGRAMIRKIGGNLIRPPGACPPNPRRALCDERRGCRSVDLTGITLFSAKNPISAFVSGGKDGRIGMCPRPEVGMRLGRR